MTLALWVAIAFLLASNYRLRHRVAEVEQDQTARMLSRDIEFLQANVAKLRRDFDQVYDPKPVPRLCVDSLYPRRADEY